MRFMIDLSDRIKEHGYSASLDVKPCTVHDRLSDRIKEHGYSASLDVKPCILIDLSDRIKEHWLQYKPWCQVNEVHDRPI